MIWHYSLRWFLGLQAVGTLLLVAFAVAQAYWLLLVLAFSIGLPAGLTYFSSLFYGMEQTTDRGSHGGNHEAIIGIGAAVGPLLGGWAIAWSGYSRANLLLGAVLVLAAVAVQAVIAARSAARASSR